MLFVLENGTRVRFMPNVTSSQATEQQPVLNVNDSETREVTSLPQNGTALPITPELPKTPGCYAWMPSGCSKQGAKMSEAYAKWRGDEKGRRNVTLCKERGAALDRWCGSSGTQMLFVPEKPTQPGCYVWRPLGCSRQQTEVYDTWRWDPKGRRDFRACKDRAAVLDQWCDSKGTRMMFVPELPKTPGCYAWRPSGCSKQGANMSEAYAMWRGDEKGRGSAQTCQERAPYFDHWCGSNGTQMLFVLENGTRVRFMPNVTVPQAP